MQNQGKRTVNLVWSNATFVALKSKSSKGRKNAGKTDPVRQMLHPIQPYMIARNCDHEYSLAKSITFRGNSL